MRFVLAPLRLVGMLILLLVGLLIAAAVFPWRTPAGRNRIMRRWSRALMFVCGVRVKVVGNLPEQLADTGIRTGERGRLLLINHISWIDIFGVAAALPARFVAKAEIGRWPLMGSLVTMSGTLYIERGRRHAVSALNKRVRELLEAGESVVVFPEGTTTDGATLLPFHSNLVAPAIESGCEVWPVALRYTQRGAPSTAAAFIGDMTLVTSMWNIVSAGGLQIEVAFLAPLTVDDHPTRHRVAQAAREAIGTYLGVAAGAAAPVNEAALQRVGD
jgi:1-acyl-sn-glycerol-3-phosphate acyltransferase